MGGLFEAGSLIRENTSSNLDAKDVRKSIPWQNIIEILKLKLAVQIKTYFSQKSIWNVPYCY